MQDLARQQAANDTNYLPPRHRTLPILASITPIANYPSKLRIFKTMASRYWQVRCYLKGRTYTQSLKTTNKQAAISQAKQFFHIKTAELYADKIQARSDRCPKFADLLPAVVQGLQGRVKRGEFAAANIPIFLQRMHNSILPYFGDMSMDQIGYKELSAFMEMMSNRDLTATTVHQHMVAIRKVFAHAHGNNIIQNLPKFPVIKVADKPRGSFTVAEYRDLVRLARKRIGEAVPQAFSKKYRSSSEILERHGVINADLHWLIRFMVNGFMRPGDIKFLKHKHVTIVRGKHIYLRLNLPETKKHDKPIVTLQPAVFVYERLLSALTTLKLSTAKKSQAMTPAVHRRLKLGKKIWEQIELAKATSAGGTYTVRRFKTVRDDEGNSRSVELPKKVRQWWWATADGKLAMNIRYGSRVIDLAKGKSSIEMATVDDLVPTLELIKKAVEAGELDAQIEAASIKLREGFAK